MPDLTNLPTADEVFAEMDAEMGDEWRARWDRTALARAVANAVVAYRTAHGITQGALAAKLEMKRPAISRLELGEHNPSIETIERLAQVLGLRFIVEVVPPGRESTPLPSDVRVVGNTVSVGGTRTLVAAG